MNLQLEETEQAVVDLARQLFTGGRGPAPATAADARDTITTASLDEVLRADDPASTVLQALVAETAGRCGVQWHAAAVLLGMRLELPAAAAFVSAGMRVRFPADVRFAVRAVGSDCWIAAVASTAPESSSRWTDPVGRVALSADEQVVDTDVTLLQAWNRMCLSAEAVGAAQAALRRITDYVGGRQQFAAPIATRQSVRHQLAELDSELRAARLMIREAAWNRASPAAATLAAAAVALLARRLVPTAHRFAGAMGMAQEFDLHVYTGRIRSLAVELGSTQRLCAEAARLWHPPVYGADGGVASA